MVVQRSVRSANVVARRTFMASAPKLDEAEATQVNLNFSSPAESIYGDTAVDMVIVPGVSGDYGVTAGHTPTISELRPGLVDIFHEDGGEGEKYFVSGGFAFTHMNSTTDISAAEVVALEDLDGAEARKNLTEFQSQLNASAEDTVEHAQAQIGFHVNEAILVALGETV